MPNVLGERSLDPAAAIAEVDRSPVGPSGLLGRLNCPSCRSDEALVADADSALQCPSCDTQFPMVTCGHTSIPWLFRQPEVARLEWSARYKGFLNLNAVEYNRLNRALKKTLPNQRARRRVESAMHARREHGNQVSSLLAPLGLDGEVLVPALANILHDKLPKNQGLTSYANNVFRDWAWNNGENDALLNAVEEVLSADRRDTIGSVLTLGAGACRLSYDMHRKYSPSLSVALDFNPLLMLIGSRIIHGDTVPLYEFPVAALEEGAESVLQQCQAPLALCGDTDSNFDFVLGDATNPPFAAQSFDTVVTPWLIDIIPQDLADFVPQLNRLLPQGGVWLNTGSLAFFHQDPLRRYSEKEVLEIVEQCGFEIVAVDRRTVSYLRSPHSAHGRSERIVSFIARKVADVESAPTPAHLPNWLLDVTRPVPGSAELIVESSGNLLTAQVMAAVDGKRSILAIARMVAREYDLNMDECVHAVSRILVGAFEDGTTVSTDWQF